MPARQRQNRRVSLVAADRAEAALGRADQYFAGTRARLRQLELVVLVDGVRELGLEPVPSLVTVLIGPLAINRVLTRYPADRNRTIETKKLGPGIILKHSQETTAKGG